MTDADVKVSDTFDIRRDMAPPDTSGARHRPWLRRTCQVPGTGRGGFGLVALIVIGAATGCGGNAKHAATHAPPKLPHALAQSWARQADAISADIASGNGCLAQTRAVALRTQVVSAVNGRRIARRYLEPLLAAVNDLPDRITCAPPAPPPPTNSKPGKAHKHHGKQGEGGD